MTMPISSENERTWVWSAPDQQGRRHKMVRRRTWRRPSPEFWQRPLSEDEFRALPDALILVAAWRERAERWIIAHQESEDTPGDQSAIVTQKMVRRLHALFVYNHLVEDKDIASIQRIAQSPPWVNRLYTLLAQVQEWVREEDSDKPPPGEEPPHVARRRFPKRRTVFTNGYALTSASKVARAIGMATQRGVREPEADGWTATPNGSLARTIRSTGASLESDEITVSLQIPGHLSGADLTPAERNVLTDMIGSLTDLDYDVLDIMLAHHRAHQDEDGYTRLTVETILQERGIAPKTTTDPDGRRRAAGYRSEDIARHAACLDRLLHMDVQLHNVEIHRRVSVGIVKKRVGKQGWLWTFECPAFEWQRLTLTNPDGETVTREIRFRPTQWQEPFVAQTMRLPQAVLQYDPEGQRWEKRISRYLLRQGRINEHKHDSRNAYRVPASAANLTSNADDGMSAEPHALRLNREIRTIMRETNLLGFIDRRNPQKTRLRFEKALHRLVKDGIIIGWDYTVAAEETLRTMPRLGWLDDYWLPSAIWVDLALGPATHS